MSVFIETLAPGENTSYHVFLDSTPQNYPCEWEFDDSSVRCGKTAFWQFCSNEEMGSSETYCGNHASLILRETSQDTTYIHVDHTGYDREWPQRSSKA